MITKIRHILGLESVSDKLSRISNIDSELKEISGTINDLAVEYTSRNEAKKILEKGDISDDILKSVTERFNSFESTHLKETSSIKKNKDSLESERKKLMSDKTISKAYGDLIEYSRFKEAYKNNIVSSEVFNVFLKAKQGKVKYADNLVFNEEGKLLIIQRAKTDKSNPEKWVVPGGHVDAGESFDSAAKRELQEESGLVVTECKKVGSYSDENAEIEYHRSEVNSQEQPIILETNESQDSAWIDPYTELDNYEMVFNMKDNIKKILNIPKDNVKVIKKALESGLLKQEAIDLLKAKNYGNLIEELNKRRDPDNIEKAKDKVGTVMGEFKDGTLKDSHGKIVTDRNQAIAIAMSEAGLSKSDDEKEEDEVIVPNNLQKAIDDGYLTPEAIDLIKARTGVYGDNATNRRLKRVGQKYGAGKQPEQAVQGKEKKQETTEPKKFTPDELADTAKNTSVGELEAAIKESKDPDVRQAAHNELKRRENEEHPTEEKFGEPKKEDEPKKTDEKAPAKTESKKEDTTKESPKKTEDVGGKKNDLETKEGIEAEIKRLRAIDTDDLDEISKISDDIQGLLKKRKEVGEKKSSERKVSFEEYRKGFKRLDPKTSVLKPSEATSFYDEEAENLKISKDEEDAIFSYTGENYEYIRMYNTDPEKYKKEYGEDEILTKEIKNLSSFISKNKIKENLSLLRNVKGKGVDFFKGLEKGDIYEDRSFSSTSLTEQKIFGDYSIEILAKKGSSVANAINGAELEYLIDKGSKFRVLSKVDTGIIVELL